MKGQTVLFGAIALVLFSVVSAELDEMIDKMSRNEEVAYRIKMAIKAAKQIESGPVQEVVRTNFLNTLYLMANASAVAGTNVSRSAAIVIRGLVQDTFNLGSIATYIPRLVFLDGPSQFIETLRLVRTNQLQIPRDMDSAIDTLINFATTVRDSPIVNNVYNPFLSFFPNIFRGAETLAGDVLGNVFAWLGPISPTDIAVPALTGLNNRWDIRSSTTQKTKLYS